MSMNRKDRRASKATGSSQGTMSSLLAQAVQLHRNGQLAQAEAAYRRLLSTDGRNADGLYLLGVLLAQKGAFDEAERLLKQAVTLRAVFPDAWYNLGALYLQKRRVAEAEAAFANCLKQQPQHANAAWNLGNLLLDLERFGEAEVIFRRLLQISPGNPDALHALAMALLGGRKFKEAEAVARQALAVRSQTKTKALLAQILFILSDYAQALPLLREVLREGPDQAEARTSLACILRRTGDLAEAHSMLKQLASERPDDSVVRLNLSMCLKDLGRYDDAIAEAEAAFQLKPDDADLRRSLSQLYLQAGHLDKGWSHHGARFDAITEPVKRMDFDVPQLALDDDLSQQTVLVWPEQGVGDQITFASALPDLMQRAGGVEILTVPKLAPLFSRSFPKARVFTDKSQGQATRQMPIGDLFPLYRSRIEDFPKTPYLFADEDRVAVMRERLAALGPGLKVGIGWRSTAVAPERVKYFFSSLVPWKSILTIPGVVFVNLQPKALCSELDEARKMFGCRIENFDDVDLFDDLDSAAALSKALDLVISNGSSGAFMAAALGVPVWMFYLADSHWVNLGTDHIPWLASLTAVERMWNEGWGSAVERIADALQTGITQGRLVAPMAKSPLRLAT